ncbi:MAG: hypothetical protein KKF44_06865 [Nanoarchaeota archaeon]|nr:hypothetical protein [Nanoarchaeota archaeon]
MKKILMLVLMTIIMLFVGGCGGAAPAEPVPAAPTDPPAVEPTEESEPAPLFGCSDPFHCEDPHNLYFELITFDADAPLMAATFTGEYPISTISFERTTDGSIQRCDLNPADIIVEVKNPQVIGMAVKSVDQDLLGVCVNTDSSNNNGCENAFGNYYCKRAEYQHSENSLKDNYGKTVSCYTYDDPPVPGYCDTDDTTGLSNGCQNPYELCYHFPETFFEEYCSILFGPVESGVEKIVTAEAGERECEFFNGLQGVCSTCTIDLIITDCNQLLSGSECAPVVDIQNSGEQEIFKQIVEYCVIEKGNNYDDQIYIYPLNVCTSETATEGLCVVCDVSKMDPETIQYGEIAGWTNSKMNPEGIVLT